MDAWALNLKAGADLLVFRPTGNLDRARSPVALRRSPAAAAAGGIQVGVSARWGMPAYGYRSALVRIAAGRRDGNNGGNDDPMFPEEGDGNTNLHGGFSDWRDSRAHLVAWEQEYLWDPEALLNGSASHEPPQKLGQKWAHALRAPETGCVLLATEKLDGVDNFERSVILLLRSGTGGEQGGPYGIILNRPLQKNARDIILSHHDLGSAFSDCAVHSGGPLEGNIFLLRAYDTPPSARLGMVVSGVFYGSRNSFLDAAYLIGKREHVPRDLRFYAGYAGWQLDQLQTEIESEYWVVAACSSRVIMDAAFVSDAVNLWQEVLLLMGGTYADMGRKQGRR